MSLSDVVHRALRDMPGVRTSRPDLTVHTFRLDADDEVNRRLLERINASGRVSMTSTRVERRYAVRMCVLNHRTHRHHVDEALRIVHDAVSAAFVALP